MQTLNTHFSQSNRCHTSPTPLSHHNLPIQRPEFGFESRALWICVIVPEYHEALIGYILPIQPLGWAQNSSKLIFYPTLSIQWSNFKSYSGTRWTHVLVSTYHETSITKNIQDSSKRVIHYINTKGSKWRMGNGRTIGVYTHKRLTHTSIPLTEAALTCEYASSWMKIPGSGIGGSLKPCLVRGHGRKSWQYHSTICSPRTYWYGQKMQPKNSQSRLLIALPYAWPNQLGWSTPLLGMMGWSGIESRL